MSAITRWHYGPAIIDARLLEWVEEALLMDTTEPAAVVIAAAERQRADGWNRPDSVSDLLDPVEAHDLLRLRGWNRARYGNLPVEAEYLSAVRNTVDGMTIGGDCTCEDTGEYFPPEVLAKIAAGHCAGECDWATLLKLRDHLDAALDRLCPGIDEKTGYGCCFYYWAYRESPRATEPRAALGTGER